MVMLVVGRTMNVKDTRDVIRSGNRSFAALAKGADAPQTPKLDSDASADSSSCKVAKSSLLAS